MRTSRYAQRKTVPLKREPKYLMRKRGLMVRMNTVLPYATAVALREYVLAKGGSLSSVIDLALRRMLQLKEGA